MSQTSYTVNQLTAFAGQLGDIGPHDIGSYVWKYSGALPAGVGVVQDTTSDPAIKSPGASTDVTTELFIGVTVLSQAHENIVSGGGSYKQNDAVSVIKKGRVWVQVEEAVTPTSPVFVRYASGAGGTQLGAFRASADTASAAQLSKARYLTSASAQGFALVDLNQP